METSQIFGSAPDAGVFDSELSKDSGAAGLRLENNNDNDDDDDANDDDDDDNNDDGSEGNHGVVAVVVCPRDHSSYARHCRRGPWCSARLVAVITASGRE